MAICGLDECDLYGGCLYSCGMKNRKNPIAKNLNKFNKPAVIPDKRPQLLADIHGEEIDEEFEIECEVNQQGTESNCN